MTPEQIAGKTEHSQQAAFFCWCNQNQHLYPCLAFAFAVPNGGERNVRVATKLKAEGVKAGVPDVFLPFPVYTMFGGIWYAGLWLEFKRPETADQREGRLSKEQIRWADYLISQKYRYVVVYDHCQAISATLNYLGR